MISRLFRRTPPDPSIASLYGTIVAQARVPAFYQSYRVPDTVNGRLEMIMLHVVLFLRRVEGEAEPVRALGQGLFDHFCRDMDANMREMGVGDLAVPRRMRQIGEAFYGRQAAYRAALAASGEEALAAALLRNVYEEAAPAGRSQAGCAQASCAQASCAQVLAAYVREVERALADQNAEGFRHGTLSFPAPAEMQVDA